MPMALRLLNDLRVGGFPVVDTVSGWEVRGNSSFNPQGVVCHWTGGPKATTKRSSLNLCVMGRSDLAGPLCNIYLDRKGIPVIVAAGRANHAGAGTWKGVTGNSGFYGIEAESAGADDWTSEQRAAYPRLVAALLRGLGKGAEMAVGHSEYATPKGRKVDINGWPMEQMRASVKDFLAGGTGAALTNEEDDMKDDERALLFNIGKAVGIIHDTVTPGIEGVKFDGALFAQTKEIGKQVWDHAVNGITGYNAQGQPTYGPLPANVRLGTIDNNTEHRSLGALIGSSSAKADDIAKALAPTVEKVLRETATKTGTLDPAVLSAAVATELANRLKN